MKYKLPAPALRLPENVPFKGQYLATAKLVEFFNSAQMQTAYQEGRASMQSSQPVAQPLTDAQIHAAIAALMSASNGDLEPTFDEMKAALMAAEKARGE